MIASQIRHFSLQLLHQELEISAGGFFSIDFTSIFHIVGAVTANCFILIQFDMASNKDIPV